MPSTWQRLGCAPLSTASLPRHPDHPGGWVRRILHCARSRSSRTCSPGGASGHPPLRPRRLRCPVHLAHPVGVEDVLAGRLRDLLRITLAAATTRSPRASGGRGGRAHGPPSGHPSAHPRAATAPPLRALAFVEDALTGCLQDIVYSLHAAATARSRRAFGDHRRLPAVRLRGIPGIVDAAATLPSPRISVADKNWSPRASAKSSGTSSGTSPGPSTRLRRFLHVAYSWPSRIAHCAPPGHPPDHLRGCDDSVPALIGRHRGQAHRLPLGHPPFHPPGCADRCSSRVRWASKMYSRAASWTSSGSSARLPRPIHLARPVPTTTCSPGHLRDRLRIIRARVSAPFTEHHCDVLALIPAASFASIGKLGTRSRRRRAR